MSVIRTLLFFEANQKFSTHILYFRAREPQSIGLEITKASERIYLSFKDTGDPGASEPSRQAIPALEGTPPES